MRLECPFCGAGFIPTIDMKNTCPECGEELPERKFIQYPANTTTEEVND